LFGVIPRVEEVPVGPYVAVNTILIGLFGFAAIYHVVLWSQSRRERVLILFAVHCVLCALLSADLLALVTAQSVEQGQRALNWRTDFASLAQVSTVWLLSLLSGVRARWYVWFITVFAVATAAANVGIEPLAGTVTGVDSIVMSWGEQVSALHRGPATRALPIVYAVVLSVPIFGFVCAARLWTRDRIGGALLITASAGMLIGNLVGAWIDASGSPGLYVGAVPYAAWVLLLSIEIAREYRLRTAQRNQALQALEQSREQLQQLTSGLLMAREEERSAIAREIHDVLGQTLTALKMDVAWIGARSPSDAPPAFRQKLDAMSRLIDETVVTVRRIATSLRPGVLDDLGLAAAVEWQANEFEQRTGIPCALRITIDDEALDPQLSTALFRILQESLTNVARHSRASHVSVRLEQAGDGLILEVRDDGVGIAAADAASTRSIGLAGMRERAQLVGGSLSIFRAAGAGTTVRAQVPHRVAATATPAVTSPVREGAQ
jgi:signal transduction histidine kinase